MAINRQTRKVMKVQRDPTQEEADRLAFRRYLDAILSGRYGPAELEELYFAIGRKAA